MVDMQPQLLGNKMRKSVRASLRIDMTPMVDLGFLLITFFIFTTTMAEKRTMKLVMPKEGDPTPVPQSKTVTALLGKDNKIFFYNGSFDDAVKRHSIVITNYDVQSGLGNLIREKQKELEATSQKEKLVYIIKPTKDATYENIIAALDEATINDVQRYAIVDVSTEDIKAIEKLR